MNWNQPFVDHRFHVFAPAVFLFVTVDLLGHVPILFALLSVVDNGCACDHGYLIFRCPVYLVLHSHNEEVNGFLNRCRVYSVFKFATFLDGEVIFLCEVANIPAAVFLRCISVEVIFS